MVLLVMLKLTTEGPRAPFLLILLTHVGLWLSKTLNHSNYALLALVVVGTAATALAIVSMPMYRFPGTTGLYGVGFQEFVLGEVVVSVYYPCDLEEATKT
jgi:hypothetical protein